MMHSPIRLEAVTLSFPHKTCFEDFSIQVPYGSRIAIIGRNGCGKSTLLKCLQGTVTPTSGLIKMPNNAQIGYVPQVIESFASLSGGQRLNKALTQALKCDPNLLLLDEPTNHLDLDNRTSLLRLLKSYSGTLIVASHDITLLNHCVDTLWYIDNGLIQLFSGNYDNFMHEIHRKRASLEGEISHLHEQKKTLHQALMKEQLRASKSHEKGKKSINERKWPTIVSKAKANRASTCSGRKRTEIANQKQAFTQRLVELQLPEIIKPKFSLNPVNLGARTIVAVTSGSVGYENKPLLHNISFSLFSDSRIAIMGNNGSGKSTLIKAIMNDPKIIKSGSWHAPKSQDIGSLDQHYQTLQADKTVLETIQKLVPTWPNKQIRFHLKDFLFRKNEEVNALVETLSGGEKARLTLAQIAALTPKLLILDEITNNLDLETKEHVIQVLQDYPGAMIVISHDEHFLRSINVMDAYVIEDHNLIYTSL
jgi:ATPase subunit of ABC transporter with duplicated ATPase domains